MNTIYHTAVIGGGITGITTSVLLKKESPQLKIILFEKNKFLGGIAGTEEKKGYYFDSVYLFPDISRFLNYLSIEHKTLKIKDSVFKYINAEEKNKWEVDIPYDTDKICKNFSKLFPEDSKAVHSFLAESLKINRQFSHLKTKFDFFDIFKLLFTSGSLMSNMHKTLEEFLNKFGFKNIKLIKVLSALSGLANLPPEELNTLISIVGFSSLQKGAFRQKNSFKEIIDNMIKKLYQSNVEVHKESSVENIKKEKGLFKITLTNNEIFFSKNIISTINTFNIFDKIVSKKNIPIKFLNKIRNLNFSHSAFIIRLIVKNCSQKYQTDTGQMLFYGGENIFSKLYSMANTDQSILDEKNFHFALAVRKQKQKDHYSVELLSIPVSYNYWKKIYDYGEVNYKNEIKKWESFFMDKLEKYFDNDIKKKIVLKKIFTPCDLEKAFGLYKGTIYDMSYIASQSGTKRLMFKTLIKNLYHVKMVHGIYGSIFQSFLFVDYLLKGKINKYRYDYDKFLQ